MSKAVDLINRLQPDAAVIQGALTWSSSMDDFDAVRAFVDRINVPVFTMPGHRDRPSGTRDTYRTAFGDLDADGTLKSVGTVPLTFASDLHGSPDIASSRIRKQLSGAAGPKAVLLFADRHGEFVPSVLKPDHESVFAIVDEFDIAI